MSGVCGGVHLLVADLEEESAAPPIALHAKHLRFSGLNLGVLGLGCGVSGMIIRVWVLGHGGWGLGFWDWVLG